MSYCSLIKGGVCKRIVRERWEEDGRKDVFGVTNKNLFCKVIFSECTYYIFSKEADSIARKEFREKKKSREYGFPY